jgi:DNA polymerase
MMLSAPTRESVEPLRYWIVERTAVNKRRAAGQPRPWSEDELLANLRFCNVNVSDDRVSRAIYETFTKPYADHPGLIVALTIARFSNEPEVFEAIKDCVVPLDPERLVAIAVDRKTRGLPLERRAYVIPGGIPGESPKLASLTRDLFVPLANAVDSLRPRPGDLVNTVFQRLRSFPYLGAGFFSAQIVRDAKWVEPLRSAADWKTFVWSGPGSQRGVNRLLGATTEAEIDHVRPEPEWRALFEEIVALVAPLVAAEGVEVEDAQSYQNTLCETDKFLRFRSGNLHGARKYTPHGEAPARRARKPGTAPTPVPVPIVSLAPIEPAPHAIPELAAARDPSVPHVLRHDIETRSTIDLKAVGAHVYAANPITDVLCLAYAVDDEPVQLWTPGDPAPPEFLEAARNPNWITIAHNDQFERLIAQHILGPRYGFPHIPIERRRCSMAMALAAALPGSLEKVIEALGLPYPKDKAGQALMRRMAKPLEGGGFIQDPASRERLNAYCRRDVEGERAVDKALQPLTAAEQQLWELDARINERGFHTDGALLDAAHQVVAAAEAALQAEFQAITGLKSTNQTSKLVGWLDAHGCTVTDVQKGTLAHALRRKGLDPQVRRAIELRRQLAHASAAKVEALRAWRGQDGRVRGTFRFHGAGTGRWTGHGPQPQNFKRDGENIEAKIAAVLAGGTELESPVEAVGDIARAMITAAPGHRLERADFSGIESRGLAWVSGQQSKVDAWVQYDRSGDPQDDPYVRIAQRCGLIGESARAVGKVIDLAFGFGGALGAWHNAPKDEAIEVATDDATALRYRDAWKAEHPLTVRFWYALQDAAINAVRNPGMDFSVRRLRYRFDPPFLRVTLPSGGRAISYPFAKIDGLDKFDRPKLTFMDTAYGRWEPCNHGNGAWYGILVENVVSGIARDLLADALIRLEAAGYPVVLHVHDEIVCEVPEDGFGTLEEFRRIVCEVPAWAEGLPIAANVSTGARFAKVEEQGVPEVTPAAKNALAAFSETPFVRTEPESTVAPDSEPGMPSDGLDIPEFLRRENPGKKPAPLPDDPLEEPLPTINDARVKLVPAAGELGLTADPPRRTNHGPAPSSPPSGNGYDSGSRAEAAADTHAEEHAGESFDDTHLRALGYQLADIFDYTLPVGTLLYRQNRYELHPQIPPTKKRPSKRFLPHLMVDGRDVLGAGPRHVLYNWPAIMRAGPGATVLAPEGESNAKALIEKGLLATTVLSHHWSPECVAGLTGCHAIILEDHDDDGRKLAADARAKLAPVAASIRVVPMTHLWKYLPPGARPLKPHDDVKDWLKLGGDPARLIDICREIPADGIITAAPYAFPNEADIAAWQWLYGRHLLRGEVACTVAMGGTGKSSKSIGEALAMASGRALLGEEVPTPLRVVLINLEDTRNTLDKRITAAMRHYGLTPADIGDRLIVLGKGEVKIKVARQLRSGDVERDQTVVRALIGLMREHKADVLSIDSFIRTHKVNENDNSAIEDVAECFEQIATETQCAMHLWHHTRKGGGERATIESARGAIALIDACRSARIMETMSSKEHAELKAVLPELMLAGYYFRSFNGKRNFAPPADQSDWFKLESILLLNGDNVGVVTRWQYPETWSDLSPEITDLILSDIDQGMPNGQRFSNDNGAKKRAAWQVIQKHCPRKTESQGREIVATWIRNGTLYPNEYKDPTDRKTRTGLFVRKATATDNVVPFKKKEETSDGDNGEA